MNRILASITLTLVLLSSAACGGKIKIPPVESSLTPWSQIGGDQYHTSVAANASHSRIEYFLKIKPVSMVGKSVVAADGIIYCGTLKGMLEAFEIQTGERVGRLKIKKPIISAPLIDNKHIYFASAKDEQNLYGYDLENGRYLWRHELGIFESSLAHSDNRLFAANRSGVLYALNKLTGEIFWKQNTRSEIIADIIAVDEYVYTGSLKGDISAFDQQSGDPVWQYGSGLVLKGAPSSDGERLFWGSVDNKLIALDAFSGDLLWSFDTNGGIYAPPAVYERQVVFGCADGYVYSVDSGTGKENWRYRAGSVVNTACIVVGGRIYFGTLNREIIGLDGGSGQELWTFPVEGRVTSNPVFYDGFVVFPVEYRFLYVFDTREE
ncbi:PQQ-binding-like beta-propeller repeat protein [candidate division KSB1 bacterium]